MNVNIINEKGYLSVEKDVVAKIAGIAATNCYGVVGMAVKTVKDGIVHLLKKESLKLQLMKIMIFLLNFIL